MFALQAVVSTDYSFYLASSDLFEDFYRWCLQFTMLYMDLLFITSCAKLLYEPIYKDFVENVFERISNRTTVLKIQLALDVDWAQPNNIMNTLALLAEKNAAMSGRSNIPTYLDKVSLALLRRQNDWHSVNCEFELFRGDAVKQAEPFFLRLLFMETAMFDEETSSSFASISSRRSGAAAEKVSALFNAALPSKSRHIANAPVYSAPKQVVVSIIATVRGKSTACTNSPVRSIEDVKKVLSSLAADAATDEGQNIMAVREELLLLSLDLNYPNMSSID
jgi:uncharacterized membrane protein